MLVTLRRATRVVDCMYVGVFFSIPNNYGKASFLRSCWLRLGERYFLFF